MRRPAISTLVLAAVLAACTEQHHETVIIAEPNPVTIEVEVYDPVSGGVWEGVGVRIVEATNEWSGCQCVSPFRDAFILSDPNGLVLFTPEDIAAYEVGFVENTAGQTVLSAHPDADEAYVVLEVWAEGFTPVFAEVYLSWSQPTVFVAIPFE